MIINDNWIFVLWFYDFFYRRLILQSFPIVMQLCVVAVDSPLSGDDDSNNNRVIIIAVVIVVVVLVVVIAIVVVVVVVFRRKKKTRKYNYHRWTRVVSTHMSWTSLGLTIQ